MEEKGQWLSQLSAAIEAHHADLETRQLSRMAELLNLYRAHFENFHNILLRKSLIQEDPYKYDQKIAEIGIPSTGDFPESERQSEMSQRLGQLQTQLEFLLSTYQPAVDYLTVDRMRRINRLLTYIRWDAVSQGAEDMVTKSLADFLARLKTGSDQVSAQIASDSIRQLIDVTGRVQSILTAVLTQRRERYKLLVRQTAMADFQTPADSEPGVQKIKDLLSAGGSEIPFSADLVRQILIEDDPGSGPAARAELLKRLKVSADRGEDDFQRKQDEENKATLMLAVRMLATCGRELEACAAKVEQNHETFGGRKRTIAQRFHGLIRRVAGGSTQAVVYDLEYMDVSTGKSRSEAVELEPFLKELGKESRLMAALALNKSQATLRLRMADEDRIYRFLERHLALIRTAHRRATGFHHFFRAEVPKERTTRVRGLRIELTAIKNSLIKSSRLRQDYASAKESAEQLRKLGAN